MKRIAAVSLVVALLGACGGGSDEEAGHQTTDEVHESAPADDDAGGAAHGGDKDETAGGTEVEATCSPQGTSLAITAQGTQFTASCLAAPAGQPFTIALDNKDSVAHNLAILESHEAEDVLFRGDIFKGAKTTTYAVPALQAGTYAFHCEVHPTTMKGTFVVA